MEPSGGSGDRDRGRYGPPKPDLVLFGWHRRLLGLCCKSFSVCKQLTKKLTHFLDCLGTSKVSGRQNAGGRVLAAILPIVEGVVAS